MNEPHIEGIIEAVKLWKLKDYAMGNRDSLPQLGFLPEGAETYEAVPQWVMQEALNAVGGDVPTALHSILYSIPMNFPDVTKLRAITFIADGYTATRDKDDEPIRGSMKEDFMSNPDTDVTECLTVLMADDDLVGGVDIAIAQVPYAMVEGGFLEFKDAVIHVDDDKTKVQGAIADVIREVWRAQSC
jgi:hypothetical protein